MATSDLDFLLVEYEQKKRDAEFNSQKRKEKIYKKIPRLEQIDEEINKISINKTKSILISQLTNSLNTEFENELLKLKKEKEEILKKENIDESYFKPNYECDKCKDTGYITYPDKKTEMCNCLKQKLINISYNKSNLSNLQKENFKNFNFNKFSNEINIGKYNMNISPRENIKNIKMASENFIKNFNNPETKNLFFTGNTGLGKTYMTNCIANEILKQGKTVLYQTAPVLLENIIDNKFNKYKTNNTNDFNNQVLNVDLLIIDDLGTECINNMKLSELFTILNSRSLNLNNKITKTIISTNLSIEKIFSVYEERIGSRIAGFYDIYYFFGDDLRLMK
ncbi:MAG: ATP-binding protein [Clostridia bacterium]